MWKRGPWPISDPVPAARRIACQPQLFRYAPLLPLLRPTPLSPPPFTPPLTSLTCSLWTGPGPGEESLAWVRGLERKAGRGIPHQNVERPFCLQHCPFIEHPLRQGDQQLAVKRQQQDFLKNQNRSSHSWASGPPFCSSPGSYAVRSVQI